MVHPLFTLLLRDLTKLLLLSILTIGNLLLASDMLPLQLVVFEELIIAVLARRPVRGIVLEVVQPLKIVEVLKFLARLLQVREENVLKVLH